MRRVSHRPRFEILEELTLLSTIPTGSISGNVWNDRNGDGAKQAGEPGLAGRTVYLDLNGDNQYDSTSTTVVAPSTDITLAPGQIGDSFGGEASTLQVQGFPSTIRNLAVNLDLANNGDSAVIVGIVSPTGLNVPNLPTLFAIQPGEHFVGSFDQLATSAVTLASRPLAPGSYRPQQAFTNPASHIYDGDPNGTWGLVFFGDTSGLDLQSWSLTFELAETSTQTDANGNYSFSGLAPGNYTVQTVLNPGDIVASSGSNVASQSVAVTAGQNTGGVGFGLHPAPDLTTTAFTIQSPATAWGQTVTVNYTISNNGMGRSRAFDVALALSNTGVISTSNRILKTLHFAGLAGGSSITASVTVTLPSAPPQGFSSTAQSYLGFVIDPTFQLTHDDHSNDSNQGLGIDSATLGVLTNTAIAPSSAVQQSPSIAVDPHNADHVVVAYMDYGATTLQNGYAGITIATSHDGGSTWTTTPIALPGIYGGGAADPAVVFDGEGNVYLSFLAATFLGPVTPGLTDPTSSERTAGFQSNNGIFVAKSADGGTSWAPAVAVDTNNYSNSGGSDVLFDFQPTIAVDTFATLPNGQPNPNYGHVYVAWAHAYPEGQYPGDPTSTGGTDVMFATSTNGGASFTTQTQTDPAGSGATVSAIQDPIYSPGGGQTPAGKGFVVTPQISVGPEGDIYVSTFGGTDFTVYHSTDDGVSFIPPDRDNQLGVPFFAVTPYPTFFADDVPTPWVRDIVADPVHPGRLYVTDANQIVDNDPAVDGSIDPGEIIFAYSNDYGQTWVPFFQVGNEKTNLSQLQPGQNDSFVNVLNDDNNGNYLGFATLDELNNAVLSGQALPSLSVDAQGNVSVVWYDTRRDPGQLNLDVYGTVSTDGGRTFSRNFRITDTSFDPTAGAFTDAAGNTNYSIGNRIGVATVNGVSYAVWTDTRSGVQQIEFQRYTISPPPQPSIDRFSPNFNLQTAANLGQVSVAQIVPKLAVGPLGNEWFTLTAGATGTLVISATADTAGSNFAIALTDQDGNVLPATITDVTNANGQFIGHVLEYASVAGDTYFVHVSTTGKGFAYSLNISDLTADLKTTVQATKTDSLGAGDTAIYRLAAGVAGSLYVSLTAGSDVQDGLTLTVLAADGVTVLGSDQGTGVAADESETVAVPVTRGQAVIVEITGLDENALGGFTLHLTNYDQYETPNNQSLFFPTGSNPTSIAVSDLTGTGTNDIVVSSSQNSDAIKVLMGNGDGTFQSPRQYGIGAGLSSGQLDAGSRELAVTKLNVDGTPDIVVPNYRAGSVSVLLGNGDGSFQPHRIFNGGFSPDSLAVGHFTGSGNTDVATLQNFGQFGGVSMLSVLIGHGDGTFAPPVEYPTAFTQGAFPVRAADFNGDGRDDIVVFSQNAPQGELFLNKGDGTFLVAGLFSTGENVNNALPIDLGNGRMGLITTGTNSGNLYLLVSNGDGTFQAPQPFRVSAPLPGDDIEVVGLTVADFGSPSNDPASPNGAPDDIPDLIVTTQSRFGSAPAQVLMLPGIADAQGQLAGFGASVVLAKLAQSGMVASGDFTHSGGTDLAITQPGGVLVIYGTQQTITANNTPSTPRNLGSVAHLVTQPQAIVRGFENAYFTYTVPTEAAPGSSDEVVDFSTLFRNVQGAGLQMEVLDASGDVLGTGSRFRIQAAQGAVLTIHVFAQTDEFGLQGVGSYTLDVNVLPQVVSVEAQSPLPGLPATSIVINLQGDRLDPVAAQDPANYTVVWLGPNGNVTIPVASLGGGFPVIYDPSANIGVTSGLSYPTAAHQTITLLFSQPLPAGSYELILSPAIQAASFAASENSSLAGGASFAGHPVVNAAQGFISNGSTLFLTNLVSASGGPGNLKTINQGTAFLNRLQNDLAALLDQLLASKGDDPSITALINAQILAELGAISISDAANSDLKNLTVIWFDPVSIDLQAPGGGGASYSMSSNAVSNGLSQTFVGVGGNVELVVMANAAGSFNLGVSDVPGTARGGGVQFNNEGSQQLSFTDALRSGENQFNVTASTSSNNEGGGSGSEGGGATAVASASGVSAAGGSASSAVLSLVSTLLMSGPETEVASTSSSAPAAGGSGAGAGSNGSETRRGRGVNQSPDDELNFEEQLSLLSELVSTLQPYLRSSFQLLDRFSGILKALGVQQRFPMVVPWQALLNFMIKADPQADKAAVKGAFVPAQEGAPIVNLLDSPTAPRNLGLVKGVLWEENIDQLLSERLLAERRENEQQSALGYGYLAASIMACGIFQSDLRATREKPRPSERPRSRRKLPMPPTL